jgi:hypothetical protein
MNLSWHQIPDWRAHANFFTGCEVSPPIARHNARIEYLLRRLESRQFSPVALRRAYRLRLMIRET